MKKHISNTFNVLIWEFNHDTIEHYDVLPYFRRMFNKRKELSKNSEDNKWFKVPKTFEDFKKFVKDESQYQFWSRCEYEMITHGWPVKKNTYKLDVHEQIMMNINVIASLLWEELKDSGKSKNV
jgi:hypothetical protein